MRPLITEYLSGLGDKIPVSKFLKPFASSHEFLVACILLVNVWPGSAPLSRLVFGYSSDRHSLLLSISLLRAYIPFRLLRLPPAVCRKYGGREGRSQGALLLTSMSKLRSTQLDIHSQKQIFSFSVYGFRMILTVISDYILKQNWLVDPCFGKVLCFFCGTDIIVKYYLHQLYFQSRNLLDLTTPTVVLQEMRVIREIPCYVMFWWNEWRRILRKSRGRGGINAEENK